MFNLVVTAPFTHKDIEYRRGMQVTDPALVEELQRLQPNSVNRVMKPFEQQVAEQQAAAQQ